MIDELVNKDANNKQIDEPAEDGHSQQQPVQIDQANDGSVAIDMVQKCI